MLQRKETEDDSSMRFPQEVLSRRQVLYPTPPVHAVVAIQHCCSQSFRQLSPSTEVTVPKPHA